MLRFCPARTYISMDCHLRFILSIWGRLQKQLLCPWETKLWMNFENHWNVFEIQNEDSLHVPVSEDWGFKRLLKCLVCKHILWDTEVISENFGSNSHCKFIFSFWIWILSAKERHYGGWGQSKTENNIYFVFAPFLSYIQFALLHYKMMNR